MGRYLEIILLVIALTQPGHTVEQTTANETSSLTCEDNEEYKKAADDYTIAIKAAFENALDGKMVNVNETLNAKSDALLHALKDCTGSDELLKSWKATVFNGFVAYALKDVSQLKELKEANQYSCILKHKIELNECINVTVTSDYNLTYSSITDLARLQFNDITCPRSEKYKTCTLNVLKKNCNASVGYVTSLFDYMHEYCKNKDGVNGSGSLKMTAVLIGLFVCIVEINKRTTL